jgi:hypothetical protein
MASGCGLSVLVDEALQFCQIFGEIAEDSSAVTV